MRIASVGGPNGDRYFFSTRGHHYKSEDSDHDGAVPGLTGNLHKPFK